MKRIIAGLLVLGLAACSEPAGAPQLQLQLAISKKQLHMGEYIWYRLEVKNVGKTTVPLYDDFWANQFAQWENWEKEQGTYLVVTDSAGKEVELSRGWGVDEIWESENLPKNKDPRRRGILAYLYPLMEREIIPSQYWWMLFGSLASRWDKNGHSPDVVLSPGEILLATPSTLSPFRERDPNDHNLEPPSDPRILPYDIHELPPARQRELRQKWKELAEKDSMFGQPGVFHPDPMATVPVGYRVLEWFRFRPGKYRIRAILDTRVKLPPLSADEEIRQWKDSHSSDFRQGGLPALHERDIREQWRNRSLQDLEQIKILRQRAEDQNQTETRSESNVLEFEVVP